MKTIFKYPLKITGRQSLKIPREAQFISVIEQENTLVLYALVDPNLTQKTYEVLISGTGNPIDEAYLKFCHFINTVKMPDGFVWHIFVERNGL